MSKSFPVARRGRDLAASNGADLTKVLWGTSATASDGRNPSQSCPGKVPACLQLVTNPWPVHAGSHYPCQQHGLCGAEPTFQPGRLAAALATW